MHETFLALPQVVPHFFSALFSGRLGFEEEIYEEPFEMDEEHLQDFLNDHIGKLSDVDSNKFEDLFNMDELEICVKDLPRHKAPGLDGLCCEFYKNTFDVIKDDFLAVQNCITEKEKFTESMRKGATRLPPNIKRGTPSVGQLRPLTMLNSDYGIRNRMIAKRMTRIMPSILSSGQH